MRRLFEGLFDRKQKKNPPESTSQVIITKEKPYLEEIKRKNIEKAMKQNAPEYSLPTDGSVGHLLRGNSPNGNRGEDPENSHESPGYQFLAATADLSDKQVWIRLRRLLSYVKAPDEYSLEPPDRPVHYGFMPQVDGDRAAFVRTAWQPDNTVRGGNYLGHAFFVDPWSYVEGAHPADLFTPTNFARGPGSVPIPRPMQNFPNVLPIDFACRLAYACAAARMNGLVMVEQPFEAFAERDALPPAAQEMLLLWRALPRTLQQSTGWVAVHDDPAVVADPGFQLAAILANAPTNGLRYVRQSHAVFHADGVVAGTLQPTKQELIYGHVVATLLEGGWWDGLDRFTAHSNTALDQMKLVASFGLARAHTSQDGQNSLLTYRRDNLEFAAAMDVLPAFLYPPHPALLMQVGNAPALERLAQLRAKEGEK